MAGQAERLHWMFVLAHLLHHRLAVMNVQHVQALLAAGAAPPCTGLRGAVDTAGRRRGRGQTRRWFATTAATRTPRCACAAAARRADAQRS